ncbi:MAG: discoidin domain-containing protein [Actinobacteria bacterium]|nr:discoidin domain-containing protein [Actinomycetota bacterium]
MTAPVTRRSMLKALGLGVAGAALSQARAPAAAAATADSAGDQYVVNGEFFSLTLDKSRGGLISQVTLFDGAADRSLNPPRAPWGDLQFGPYSLANATDGTLVSATRASGHLTAVFTATPRDATGNPAGFGIRQEFAIYDAGVVDVIVTSPNSAAPAVAFPVDAGEFPRSQAFDPGGTFTHTGVTETGTFLSSRPVGYANGLQTWLEGPYPGGGGYQSGWGFTLAVQRQQDPLIGTRTVHYQDEEGNNAIWPPNSYIDGCAELGVNLSIIHIYWKKYQWGEPNYRNSGNYGDLLRFVEYNKQQGIRPVLYAMPHYDPAAADPFFGLDSEWYDKTGAEGIYFDFGSDYLETFELPHYDKLILHNYTLRNAYFRQVVGKDGILIAHSGVTAPDLHFVAFCNAYLPGEAAGQTALTDNPDQASTIGGLAYSVVKPWTVFDEMKDPKAFSMFAGAGIYPHALTGRSTHPGYPNGGLLNPRNPFLALKVGYAPFFQLLRAMPMGAGTTLYNFNTTQVATADSPDALVSVYRRQGTDETLVVVTNRAASPAAIGVRLDQQELGMSGSYGTYLIAGNTVGTLAVTRQGASSSGTFTTPSLGQYEYCGMLFSNQDKSGYVASVAAVRAVYANTEPPGPVTGIRADDIGKAVRLSWDPAPAGEHVAAYYVYRSEKGGPSTRVNPSVYDYDEVTWFTDKHVVPATLYAYRVTAVDAAGNEGPASDPVALVVNGGRTPATADYTAVKLLSAPAAATPATGFKFRYQDDSNYYCAYFGGNGGGDGGLHLSKVAGGKETILGWVGLAHLAVFDHVIRVEAYGPKLRLYCDGILQTEATDTAFATGGPVDADLVTENVLFRAKIADFSTQLPGAEAANVTDGDAGNGVWQTTDGKEQHVTIDLGASSEPLAQLRIKAGFDIETPADMTIGTRYDAVNPKLLEVFGLQQPQGTGGRVPLLAAATVPELMSCRDVTLSLARVQPVRYLQVVAHTGYAPDRIVVGEIEGYPPGDPPQPAVIQVSPASVVLAPGQAQTAQATVTSQYNDPLPDPGPITWTSADESVATVDGDGRIIAVSGGTTTVEASIGQIRSMPIEVIVGINVVLRKPVTGFSSQLNDNVWAASNIDDGRVDATSRGWAGPGTNQWVTIDLGAATTIFALRITGEDSLDNRNVKDYVLYGSDTGAFAGEERVLSSGTVPPLTHLTAWAAAFSPAAVRYLKFLGRDSYSPYIIVGELEIFGSGG